MGHGEFRDNQAATVAGFVKGKVVHDLGAGDLCLAQQLVEFGAEKVIAVDRYSPLTYSKRAKLTSIDIVTCYFHDYKGSVKTAFLSWPVNWYDYSLGNFIEQAEMVIYLGSNLDGSACGYPDMWVHLSQREVLAHIPHRKNTLIVYGPEFVKRAQLPEEFASLNQARMYRFEELNGGQQHDRPAG